MEGKFQISDTTNLLRKIKGTNPNFPNRTIKSSSRSNDFVAQSHTMYDFEFRTRFYPIDR